MIYIIAHENGTGPVKRLLKTASKQLPKIKLITYQSLFKKMRLPVGTLIFTDFDFLNIIEMEAAAKIAITAQNSGLNINILNHPTQVLERYALLQKLHALGTSPVQVKRLDEGNALHAFPMFFRAEDGCWANDTALLHNQQEYENALNDLVASGKPLKGRIAVSFHSEKDSKGYYRKYGAFKVGEAIIPHHLLRSKNWVVKSGSNDFDESFAREEFDYITNNPHETLVNEIFKIAGIQYGRIDYSFEKGKIVVFEINTNPTFPKFKGGNPERNERRAIILHNLKNAFKSIDSTHIGDHKTLPFDPPKNGYRWMQLDNWSAMRRLLWRLKIGLRKKRSTKLEA